MNVLLKTNFKNHNTSSSKDGNTSKSIKNWIKKEVLRSSAIKRMKDIIKREMNLPSKDSLDIKTEKITSKAIRDTIEKSSSKENQNSKTEGMIMKIQNATKGTTTTIKIKSLITGKIKDNLERKHMSSEDPIRITNKMMIGEARRGIKINKASHKLTKENKKIKSRIHL